MCVIQRDAIIGVRLCSLFFLCCDCSRHANTHVVGCWTADNFSISDIRLASMTFLPWATAQYFILCEICAWSRLNVVFPIFIAHRMTQFRRTETHSHSLANSIFDYYYYFVLFLLINSHIWIHLNENNAIKLSNQKFDLEITLIYLNFFHLLFCEGKQTKRFTSTWPPFAMHACLNRHIYVCEERSKWTWTRYFEKGKIIFQIYFTNWQQTYSRVQISN